MRAFIGCDWHSIDTMTISKNEWMRMTCLMVPFLHCLLARRRFNMTVGYATDKSVTYTPSIAVSKTKILVPFFFLLLLFDRHIWICCLSFFKILLSAFLLRGQFGLSDRENRNGSLPFHVVWIERHETYFPFHIGRVNTHIHMYITRISGCV